MDFCKVTEELWRVYLTAGRKENREALGILAPDCVIIGTGKHEFYTNMEDFALALGEEISERQDISFQIKDFWCEQKELGPDACFVYGGIHIWWESEDQKIHIDMDSRFSLIFRQTDEGWKVVHLHQSLPNKEQMDGEFYPKTLTEQVKQAQKTAEEMAWLAQRDSLTGLINYPGGEMARMERKRRLALYPGPGRFQENQRHLRPRHRQPRAQRDGPDPALQHPLRRHCLPDGRGRISPSL